MRLHELDFDKIDPNLSKAVADKLAKARKTNVGGSRSMGTDDELDAGIDTPKQQPMAPQAGSGTGPSMQMPRSQIKVTPITMKNYQGGMARSMSGV